MCPISDVGHASTVWQELILTLRRPGSAATWVIGGGVLGDLTRAGVHFVTGHLENCGFID